MKFGIGQPVPRTEDPRFLTGQGRYVDDLTLPNQAYGYVLRSPHAHAKVNGIKTDAAKRASGVLGVYTRADLDADGIGMIPPFITAAALGGPQGFVTVHPILAKDRVRHVGQPVAFVVGETLEAAKDAAELIEVDYEQLPAVAYTADATATGAAQVWDGAARNLAFEMARGDKAATDAAFAKAAHVTKLRIVNNRVSANTMEPRCSVAEYRSATDHYTLWTSSQGPHKLRPMLAAVIFKKPANNFRIINPDVGGGFGMKGDVFPEDALVVWASKKVGRPVRWVAERSEGLVSDNHGRDAVSDAELALDKDGRILGFRATTDFALGAYMSMSSAVPAVLGSLMFTGTYDIPAVHTVMRGVMTHTPPTAPYRGAGRPEAIYVIERLIDTAAREMKLDAVQVRRRNMIKPDKMPYQTKFMTVYDSGEFERVMDETLKIADVKGFPTRKAESEKRGKLRGLGVAYFIELSAPFNDRMELHFDEIGNVTVVAGTHSHGQGHETAYAQLVHEWLGVPFEHIRLVQGDTDTVSFGRGTYGSRSLTVGGSALKDAADQVIAKARRMAGHMLEAAETDIEFKEGTFRVAGTDKKVGIQDIARASYMPVGWPAQFGIGLEATGTFSPTSTNWPNGCHVCEVEVDPDTGKAELVRFSAVDDSGIIVNPLLFEGQIHGGLAMGIGQALLEDVAFDPKSGQMLSGSFMDYTMPRADDLPSFHTDDIVVPCKTNPLGVKGAGESGTVGATPAVIHAIIDALKPLGVSDVALPATPLNVWRAIKGAKKQAA
jgi:carbon-monoxide dehydrogenase large subunit